LNIEHIIQEEVEKTDKNMEIFRDIFNKQVSETYLWRQNPK
jgi:predicted component of type VI protein secretion system